MEITFKIKRFNELSTTELYSLLQLRSEVFVVEQNRDAQMHSMLVNELDVDPARLIRVLHYDGTPITARFIAHAIRQIVQPQIPDARKVPRSKEIA